MNIRNLRALPAAAAALCLVTGLGWSAGPASADPSAATPSGPVLHYDLTSFDGSPTIVDASGNAHDGAFRGTYSNEEGALQFSGDDFVTLPTGLMTDLDEITVTTRLKTRTSGNHFVWGLGNTRTSDGIGYGYLFQNSNFRSAISPTQWEKEENTTAGALPQDTWVTIGLTIRHQSDGTYTMTQWQNGLEKGSTTITTLPKDIAAPSPGTVSANYLGKSLYNGDQLFKGAISDFRIYDRALSDAEMITLGASPTAILGVELESLKTPAIIDEAAGTIVLPVVPGTDLTSLAPRFSVTANSTVSPDGVRDYSSPVTVTVSSDGASRAWTVSAVEMRSPVLPGFYADPNIAVFDDVFYIYATSDGYPGWGGKEFYSWKSTDLVHWTRSEKPFLTLDGDAGNVPWATGNAWAPTIIERDGKYYFYFSGHNPAYDRKTIGVAVADSPEGPFTAEPTAMILNNESVTSGQAIDPATFRDPETGKFYLFWGNGKPLYAELADDMTSLKPGTIKAMAGLTDYREGSFVNYRDGRYHLTYSIDDTGSPNYRVGYATAPTVDGPWTHRGAILEKDPSKGIYAAGHNSVIQVPGTDDWYIAYHRFGIPGGDGQHRETTIDRLTFDADGFMEKVIPTLTSIDPVDLAPEPSTSPEPSQSPEPSETPSPEPSVSPSASPGSSMSPTAAPSASPTTSPAPTVTITAAPPKGDLYSTPGFHEVNGRWWHTTCESYSQTIRCRTEIWSTRVERTGGKFVSQTGWHFNNLTYLPFMTRAKWGTNPLANTGTFTSSGRQWKTECDTAATGRNGCRSFMWMKDVVEPTRTQNGSYRYRLADKWVFNNIVSFK